MLWFWNRARRSNYSKWIIRTRQGHSRILTDFLETHHVQYIIHFIVIFQWTRDSMIKAFKNRMIWSTKSSKWKYCNVQRMLILPQCSWNFQFPSRQLIITRLEALLSNRNHGIQLVELVCPTTIYFRTCIKTSVLPIANTIRICFSYISLIRVPYDSFPISSNSNHSTASTWVSSERLYHISRIHYKIKSKL